MSNFIIVHDLSTLSDAQRVQYLRDLSSHIGLEPDMNALDTIWMNNDTGVRRLVAYCRRGITDILREIYGINVLSLVQHDGPGYVSFTATGCNPDNRQEMAVGAHAIAGMFGDKLAAAVATAQTRALRRLTLQFVGCGLLDESEVCSTVSQENTTPTHLAPVPMVKPNNENGEILAIKGDESVGVKDFIESLTFQKEADEIVAPEEKKARKPRNSKKKVDISAPGDEPKKLAEPENLTVTLPSEVAERLNVTVQQKSLIPECPDCHKPMTEESRFDLYVCLEHGKVDQSIKPSQVLAMKPEFRGTGSSVAVTDLIVANKPVPLTDEERVAVKKRLAPYWCEILPKQGGMSSDEGLGVYAKVVAFANKFVPGVHYSDFTQQHWDEFIAFLEQYNAENGPVQLTKYIESKIA